jgi:tryptophan-rich sensory protein
VLIIFIVLLVFKYKNISLLSMYLMIPYLLWCCFALLLNINIFLIN